MKFLHTLPLLCLFLLTISISSCRDKVAGQAVVTSEVNKVQDKVAMLATMTKHLDAVSNKDLETLQSTMHPEGKMQLILAGQEIIDGVDGFMEYHREWFELPNWTFETRILNSEISANLGMAVTEVIYREPERDGKPYFNRLIVSYDLEKLEGHWYVIKDHASSVEKSTDME